MFSKAKSWCLSAMLLVGIVTPVYAEQVPTAIDVYYVPMQFVFDKEVYAPGEEQKGFIYEGSTYVPLRFISYSLKKAVRWDGATYTVTVEEPKTADLVDINDYNANTKVRGGASDKKADTSNLVPSKISAYKEKVNYVFDGKSKETSEDLPGFIFEDSLYVPMRFFSESVGKTITWDPATYTVSSDSQEAPKTVVDPSTPGVETPVTSNPLSGGGGSGSGGSSSGGTSANNSAAQADAESKLTALENSCRVALQPIADQYLNPATDDTTKGGLFAQGSQIQSDCNAQFNSIMSTARSLGVSQSLLQSYQTRFDQLQRDAIADLVAKLKASYSK